MDSIDCNIPWLSGCAVSENVRAPSQLFLSGISWCVLRHAIPACTRKSSRAHFAPQHVPFESFRIADLPDAEGDSCEGCGVTPASAIVRARQTVSSFRRRPCAPSMRAAVEAARASFFWGESWAPRRAVPVRTFTTGQPLCECRACSARSMLLRF